MLIFHTNEDFGKLLDGTNHISYLIMQDGEIRYILCGKEGFTYFTDSGELKLFSPRSGTTYISPSLTLEQLTKALKTIGEEKVQAYREGLRTCGRGREEGN
jgi:hypothetical protein